MTYIPGSHGIDFSVILQDNSIEIPPDEFSWLNELAAYIAASPLEPFAERGFVVAKTGYWPKDPTARRTAAELLFMDEETPSRDLIKWSQNKYELLALYLYDSAYQQMMEN